MANNRRLAQVGSFVGSTSSDKISFQTNTGIGTTNPTSRLTVSGDTLITGVITATNFSGDLNTSGVVTATTFSGNISGVAATFTGNVTIGGTLTYEDVTNIDAIGLITARNGLQVLSGITTLGVSTISVNSASDALRITQTGTGNALVVEDSANPDATAFIIDNAGKLGVGTDNPNGHGLSLYDSSLQLITSGEGGGFFSGLSLSYQSAFDAYYILNWIKPLYIGGGADVILQDNANNVGIGSTIPTAKLDVTGHTELDTLNVSGVSTFQGDANVTGNLTVDTNTLFVNSTTNRIGIGTTNPAYQVEIENTGANALLVLDRTDGAACFIEGQETRSAFGSVNATPLALAYDSLAVVTIGAGGSIRVNPDGDGFTFPTTDGSANQVLQTDGDGNISFATVISNVVEDTTPQLGGDLDLNSKNVTGTGNFNVTGVITATSFSGNLALSNVTGLAANVATFLATPSSANLASAVTDETGSGALVFATSPTLVTPALGQASATSINATGVITATTFDGSLATSNLSGTITNDQLAGSITNAKLVNSSVSFGGVSVSLGSADSTPAFNLADATGLPVSTGISGLGANVATFLATPSSANLASAVTGETGSGALVFATSPTLVTPTLGQASATSINASGIVTATGGFNIGIQSAGTSITSGSPVTTLNFVGTGNTFAFNGTTVDISIAGGGGGGGGVSEVETTVSTTNATGVGSFAVATYRSADVIAQISQGSNYQVGRYLMIHDGTTVTVVEESSIATGSMLGSFNGVINGANAELRVTLVSAGTAATVTTKIDTVTIP